jgi:tRNA-dihydrouridine synthase
MIGRAAIGYPWILMKLSIILILENIWLNRQLLIECKQYVIIWAMEWKGERLGIVETRPHYTNYFKGDSFKPHKLKLVTLDHPQELFAVLNEIEDAYAGYEFA